ncbi:MAG: prolipoprotein diacylglyceryl transferase [Defluviimonas denitrificans]
MARRRCRWRTRWRWWHRSGFSLGRIANFINAELWGRPDRPALGRGLPGPAAQDCAGIEPGLCARHPSQLYEAGMEGLILGLDPSSVAGRAETAGPDRRHLPGPASGLSRFIVESVRQADAQFVTAGNPLGHVLQLGPVGLSMTVCRCR